MLIITAYKGIWGKVILLHLYVIMFTGGSTWAGTSPWPVTPLSMYPRPVSPTRVGIFTTRQVQFPDLKSNPPRSTTPSQLPPSPCMSCLLLLATKELLGCV